jgi:hypothetical protein
MTPHDRRRRLFEQSGERGERLVGTDVRPYRFAVRRRGAPPAAAERGDDIQTGREAAGYAFTPDRRREAGVRYRDDDALVAALEADTATWLV